MNFKILGFCYLIKKRKIKQKKKIYIYIYIYHLQVKRVDLELTYLLNICVNLGNMNWPECDSKKT